MTCGAAFFWFSKRVYLTDDQLKKNIIIKLPCDEIIHMLYVWVLKSVFFSSTALINLPELRLCCED